jgi:hypothetical protein
VDGSFEREVFSRCSVEIDENLFGGEGNHLFDSWENRDFFFGFVALVEPQYF